MPFDQEETRFYLNDCGQVVLAQYLTQAAFVYLAQITRSSCGQAPPVGGGGNVSDARDAFIALL